VPNIVCPYCGRAARFADPEHRLPARFRQWPQASMGISTCPACGHPVMFGLSPYRSDEVIDFLPHEIPAEPDPLIPEVIRSDLHEAQKCMTVDAYKGVAVMCRRSLQGACIDQGAGPGTLSQQIEEVVGANKVHGALKEWADAIRLVGNDGAHPGEDGLDTVSEEDARDILDFTEQFLDLVYVVSARVKNRLATRRPPSAEPAGGA